MSIIVCASCTSYVDTDFRGIFHDSKANEDFCAACVEHRSVCEWCGELRGLRESIPASPCGRVEASYCCEACFKGTDTGPCFDDLSALEVTT